MDPADMNEWLVLKGSQFEQYVLEVARQAS
jgi:hypothetical protein